jgi:Protein of unknown function (DUF3147)
MVEFKLSDIKETKPIELGVRFLFGGLCTVGAGLIARRYGPAIGGLFLAFPAIFPASATLIQAHEKEKKAQIGSDGTRRGRMSASVDAAGSALGCCGLFAFAWINWKALTNYNPAAVITAAIAAWLAVSILFWEIRKRRIFGR